jgi:hypothetical protein
MLMNHDCTIFHPQVKRFLGFLVRSRGVMHAGGRDLVVMSVETKAQAGYVPISLVSGWTRVRI